MDNTGNPSTEQEIRNEAHGSFMKPESAAGVPVTSIIKTHDLEFGFAQTTGPKEQLAPQSTLSERGHPDRNKEVRQMNRLFVIRPT
jgi:hypothetical protein